MRRAGDGHTIRCHIPADELRRLQAHRPASRYVTECRCRPGGARDRSQRVARPHRRGHGRPHRRRRQASAPAFIRRQIPPYELLGEEGLALVERKADRLLAEVGIEIRDDEESLQLFRARRRDGRRRHGALRPRPCAGAVRHRAATVHPARPQPGPVGADRRRTTSCWRPTYGSPFVRDLAGGRRYGIARRLPELRQAGLRHAVAAPLRRHGLRADRRAGQQAPPRHGVRPPALQRQGVHGLGHRTRRGPPTPSRWRASRSAPTWSTTTASSSATSTSTRRWCGTPR